MLMWLWLCGMVLWFWFGKCLTGVFISFFYLHVCCCCLGRWVLWVCRLFGLCLSGVVLGWLLAKGLISGYVGLWVSVVVICVVIGLFRFA